MIADEIYKAVEKLHREAMDALELTDPGTYNEFGEGRIRAFAQVMQTLQDDFGVVPAPWSLT